MIKYISQIKTKEFKDKKIILRLDFNVPVLNGEVTSDFRIQKSLKTMKFLEEVGAKIIIISHISEKEGGTLLPVSQ